MKREQPGWWQKNRPLLIIMGIIAAFTGMIALIFVGYRFNLTWTGFHKTLWDWMQLLIIPVALAIAALLFNRTERKSEQRIAIDSQRQATLQEYLDRMSELLLERDLRTSQPDDEVRNVARARTLTVLSRINTERKGSLLQFLSESHLISVIDLSGADFTGVRLRKADLRGARLAGAKLTGADLSGADLSGANLTGANLRGVDLREASLTRANLSGAKLTRANLTKANLTEANLYIATLPETILHKANLAGAKLIGANLIGADLTEADLTRADFTEAVLFTADLARASLGKTKITRKQMERTSSISTILVGSVIATFGAGMAFWLLSPIVGLLFFVIALALIPWYFMKFRVRRG